MRVSTNSSTLKDLSHSRTPPAHTSVMGWQATAARLTNPQSNQQSASSNTIDSRSEDRQGFVLGKSKGNRYGDTKKDSE